jgi:protein SCO1/2
MPAMIMPFELKEPKAAADLKTGDAISFRLLVDDKKAVIDRISKLSGRDLDLPPPAPESIANTSVLPRLRTGDELPVFSLTNQNGETITQETFRGQPLVLTFIFTRCPVPNFCPLMSQNFAQLQNAIRSGSGAVGATRLLSISFDPDHDTPPVLQDYAAAEHAESRIWTFATGTPSEIGELTKRFAVQVQPEGGTISHGLATALIDSHGRIREIWRGNGWKPEEIIAALAKLPP